MPVHSLVQFDFPRTLWCGAQLLVVSVSAALIIASIITGIDVSVATAHSGAMISGDDSGQIVNRIHKGNRQQVSLPSPQNAKSRLGETDASQVQKLDLKLPIGCESLISPLAHPQLSRVARRCLS